MTDTEILEKLITNDPTAWSMIHERFKRLVISEIQKKVTNPLDAEELLNDVFVKLQHNCEEVKSIEILKARLFIVINSVTIDYLRKLNLGKNIRTENYDEIEKEIRDESNHYYQENTDTMDNIYNEVNNQPPERRRVYLFLLEGLKPKDIAKEMGISQSTVYSHKSAVEKDLINKLGPKARKYEIPD
jgi:RNA polymerase sigma factor (sigma-70 family)